MNSLNIKKRFRENQLRWGIPCGNSAGWGSEARRVAADGKVFYGLSVGSAPFGNSTHISPACFMLPAWAPAWAPKPQ
jgi:hypothetical protein